MSEVVNNDPGTFELSELGQMIRVTASQKNVLLDTPEDVTLGHISHEQSGSIDATVVLQHKVDRFACYATVELPDNLATRPIDTFHRLARSLSNDGKVGIIDNYTCMTQYESGIFNLIKLQLAPEKGSSPTIFVSAKDRDKSVGYDLAPDELKYDEYPVDNIVIGVGHAVANIANTLHEMNASGTSATLDIALPGLDLYNWQEDVPEFPPSHNCLPEHANFPDFECFGGLDNEIARLKDAALDAGSPELLKKYGLEPKRGILLQGPGGVGKTDLVRALAKATRSNYYEIRISDIMDPYVGKSERNLRQLFEQARKSGESTILFFDECDGLFSNNAGGNEGGARSLIAELKGLLMNARDYPNLLVIMAANSLNNFDPALLRPGRIDTVIKIGMPGESARTDIFNKYFYAHANHFDVLTLNHLTETPINPAQLATLAEDFSGADIKAVLTELLWQKMRRERTLGQEPPRITHNEIVRAIAEHRQNRPSDI